MRRTIITCDKCGVECGVDFVGKTISTSKDDATSVSVEMFKNDVKLDLCKKCGVEAVSNWVKEMRGDLFK